MILQTSNFDANFVKEVISLLFRVGISPETSRNVSKIRFVLPEKIGSDSVDALCFC